MIEAKKAINKSTFVINKKNARKSLIFSCLFLVLWVIFGFNTANADQLSYQNWYRLTGLSNQILDRFEIGFSIGYRLGNILKLDFQTYLAVFSFIGLALVANSIYRYAKKPCLVILLYFIYPFLFDVVQLRNFMAFAIMMYSLRFLESFNKENVIKFLLCFVISMSFHSSSFFYIFFLFAYLKDFKWITKISIFMTMGCILIAVFGRGLIMRFIDSETAQIYLFEGMASSKMIGYLLFACLTVILVYKYNKSNVKNTVSNEFLIYIIPLTIVSTPFILLNSQFYRFYRNMILITYIVLTNLAFSEKSKDIWILSEKKFILFSFSIFLSVFFFWRQLSPGTDLYQTVTEPIFNNNLILNNLGGE